MKKGFAVVVSDAAEAVNISVSGCCRACLAPGVVKDTGRRNSTAHAFVAPVWQNRVGPEHLEIQTENAAAVGKSCDNYGGLFVGEIAAEVLGDYGAGPNHVLPTGE